MARKASLIKKIKASEDYLYHLIAHGIVIGRALIQCQLSQDNSNSAMYSDVLKYIKTKLLAHCQADSDILMQGSSRTKYSTTLVCIAWILNISRKRKKEETQSFGEFISLIKRLQPANSHENISRILMKQYNTDITKQHLLNFVMVYKQPDKPLLTNETQNAIDASIEQLEKDLVVSTNDPTLKSRFQAPIPDMEEIYTTALLKHLKGVAQNEDQIIFRMIHAGIIDFELACNENKTIAFNAFISCVNTYFANPREHNWMNIIHVSLTTVTSILKYAEDSLDNTSFMRLVYFLVQKAELTIYDALIILTPNKAKCLIHWLEKELEKQINVYDISTGFIPRRDTAIERRNKNYIFELTCKHANNRTLFICNLIFTNFIDFRILEKRNQELAANELQQFTNNYSEKTKNHCLNDDFTKIDEPFWLQSLPLIKTYIKDQNQLEFMYFFIRQGKISADIAFQLLGRNEIKKLVKYIEVSISKHSNINKLREQLTVKNKFMSEEHANALFKKVLRYADFKISIISNLILFEYINFDELNIDNKKTAANFLAVFLVRCELNNHEYLQLHRSLKNTQLWLNITQHANRGPYAEDAIYLALFLINKNAITINQAKSVLKDESITKLINKLSAALFYDKNYRALTLEDITSKELAFELNKNTYSNEEERRYRAKLLEKVISFFTIKRDKNEMQAIINSPFSSVRLLKNVYHGQSLNAFIYGLSLSIEKQHLVLAQLQQCIDATQDKSFMLYHFSNLSITTHRSETITLPEITPELNSRLAPFHSSPEKRRYWTRFFQCVLWITNNEKLEQYADAFNNLLSNTYLFYKNVSGLWLCKDISMLNMVLCRMDDFINSVEQHTGKITSLDPTSLVQLNNCPKGIQSALYTLTQNINTCPYMSIHEHLTETARKCFGDIWRDEGGNDEHFNKELLATTAGLRVSIKNTATDTDPYDLDLSDTSYKTIAEIAFYTLNRGHILGYSSAELKRPYHAGDKLSLIDDSDKLGQVITVLNELALYSDLKNEPLIDAPSDYDDIITTYKQKIVVIQLLTQTSTKKVCEFIVKQIIDCINECLTVTQQGIDNLISWADEKCMKKAKVSSTMPSLSLLNSTITAIANILKKEPCALSPKENNFLIKITNSIDGLALVFHAFDQLIEAGDRANENMLHYKSKYGFSIFDRITGNAFFHKKFSGYYFQQTQTSESNTLVTFKDEYESSIAAKLYKPEAVKIIRANTDLNRNGNTNFRMVENIRITTRVSDEEGSGTGNSNRILYSHIFLCYRTAAFENFLHLIMSISKYYTSSSASQCHELIHITLAFNLYEKNWLCAFEALAGIKVPLFALKNTLALNTDIAIERYNNFLDFIFVDIDSKGLKNLANPRLLFFILKALTQYGIAHSCFFEKLDQQEYKEEVKQVYQALQELHPHHNPKPVKGEISSYNLSSISKQMITNTSSTSNTLFTPSSTIQTISVDNEPGEIEVKTNGFG